MNLQHYIFFIIRLVIFYYLWSFMESFIFGLALYILYDLIFDKLMSFYGLSRVPCGPDLLFNKIDCYILMYAYTEKIQSIDAIKQQTDFVSFTGAMYRYCEVIEEIDILVGDESIDLDEFVSETIPLNFIQCNSNVFYRKLVETSSTKEHLEGINFKALATKKYDNEESIYSNLSIQYCEPELREGLFELEKANQNNLKINNYDNRKN